MDRKEELIKELNSVEDPKQQEDIADFILAREDTLLREIEEPLKKFIDNVADSDLQEGYCAGVLQTLAIIEKRRKG